VKSAEDQRIAELERAVAERDATIAVLQETVKVLLARVEDLEARLNRNSGNSDVPPSANPPNSPKPTPKKPTGKKPGGQPGHRGHHRAVAVPDVVKDHHPICCPHCESTFTGDEAEVGAPVCHQVTEIPPVRPIVTEHRCHRLRCRSCRRPVLAPVPVGVPSGAFGPRVVAMVALLSGRHRVSRRGVAEFLADAFGLRLGLGSVQTLCEAAGRMLEGPYEEIKRMVLAEGVAHADETSWRHRGRRHWVWVVANRRGAVFKLAKGRGHEARRQLLPDDYPGVVVSDRWHVYEPFENRALCHAHLLRNWRAISERKDPKAKRLGDRGVAETDRMLGMHRDYRHGVLSELAYRLRIRIYSRLLNDALECEDAKTKTLAQELCRLWECLWTFSERDGVEPTNNEGECEIRPAVLWRKVSLGTQSDAGQRFVERILTVGATARKIGTRLFGFLFDLSFAHLNQLPWPSLYGQQSTQLATT
jgi:transposase